jgi:hypothetical protein
MRIPVHPAGRMGGLPAAVAYPPEVIIWSPGRCGRLSTYQDHSSSPALSNSGRLTGLAEVPYVPLRRYPGPRFLISAEQLNCDEPGQPIIGVLKAVDQFGPDRPGGRSGWSRRPGGSANAARKGSPRSVASPMLPARGLRRHRSMNPPIPARVAAPIPKGPRSSAGRQNNRQHTSRACHRPSGTSRWPAAAQASGAADPEHQNHQSGKGPRQDGLQPTATQ